jgi:peptidoglycan/LPS O-acetylase OafA/YrhL
MTSKRNFGLDLLRAIAIAAVFLGHEVTFTGVPFLSELGTGVDLFFVLSGFLIGRIYFRSSTQPDFTPLRFWRSRWWRTIPPYFAALALYVLADRVLLQPSHPELPWYYCFFLQNYLGMTGFGPSWSLCVEEHFYLSLPLLAFLADRFMGRKSLYYLLPIMFIIPTLLRVSLIEVMRLSPRDWYYMTHFHCDGLISGLWLAYLFVERPDVFASLRKPAIWISFMIPIAMAVKPLCSPQLAFVFDMYWYAIIAIGFSGWLRWGYDLHLQPSSAPVRLLHQAIQGLALCSYSVYLTHTTIDVLVRSWLVHWHRGVIKTGLVMLVTFAVSVVFYFLFERPAILIRDRIEAYHRSKQRAIEPVTSTA